MKSKLLIGLIVGLVFNIICNAALTLSDIKFQIDYNSIDRTHEQLREISQTKVTLPSVSLLQLKKDEVLNFQLQQLPEALKTEY